ncbi:hypothetical protein DFH09DRAFT_1360295 [Mycena vulgaris]|nr:hypothetical protein DFH09DRAFT_1360295 [Mycena vulgaris]
MNLRCSRLPFQPRTLCTPSHPPSRALHTSPVLNSRYRGLLMHGTMREWALRMINKELGMWGNRGAPVPPDAMRLMRDADEMVASVQRNEARRNSLHDLDIVKSADALVRRCKRPREGKAQTEEQRERDTAMLREALRLYHVAGQHPSGMLPSVGSRILGLSRLLERRIHRAADHLEVVRRNPLVALKDEVGWGISNEAEARSEPPPSSAWGPRGLQRRPNSPRESTPRSPAFSALLYKSSTLPPLPPLPLSAVQHAALPLMSAFPGTGRLGSTTTSLSLAHGQAATRGFIGTPPAPPSSHYSAPPSPPAALNPVVGVGEGTPIVPWYLRGSEADARGPRPAPVRNFPLDTNGRALRWFRRRPMRRYLMKEYYPAEPPPPPPPPPTPFARMMSARLGGRIRR